MYQVQRGGRGRMPLVYAINPARPLCDLTTLDIALWMSLRRPRR